MGEPVLTYDQMQKEFDKVEHNEGNQKPFPHPSCYDQWNDILSKIRKLNEARTCLMHEGILINITE